MELTKEQIQIVENYLNKKKFDFIDLRVEILDHMLSDIEDLVIKKYSFENAFKLTILKWEMHFKETSSFYFGIQYSASKLVIKKAVKIFKPFYFIYLTAYILPFILFQKVKIQFSETSVNFMNGFLSTTTFIALMYLLIIAVKTKQSKFKTTYRFIMKTQYLGVVFLIIPLFGRVFFNDKGEVYPIFSGFVCAGFSVVFICHHFYKKHFGEILKHKVS